MVRVLHASPDAPAVDVKVDDSNVLTNVPFKTISEYLAVPGGTYNIKVCVAGSDATDPANCVIDADLPFDAGTMYTVAATNAVASIEAQVLVDAPADDAENAQVRVVHFSADTPAVDVLTQDKSAKVVENLAYPDATDYLALPEGSYDLIVCANADSAVCPLDPGALDLAAGTAYSVFAVGSLNSEASLSAVVAVDATFEAAQGGNGGANATPPPTSTIAPTTEGSSSNGNMLAILGLLGIAGLATVGMSRRFAARRVEK
jgi:hypothetical protein